MDKICGTVYAIFNVDGTCEYVGSTTERLWQRQKVHRYRLKHPDAWTQKIYKHIRATGGMANRYYKVLACREYAFIQKPKEDFSTLITSIQTELDMDEDVLPVEAEYEVQANRMAELAAQGTPDPEIFIPVASDMGGAQLEAALALDPEADFWEIDLEPVSQIGQHRSSLVDIMLREAEAAGFPYDRIHIGGTVADS